MLDKTNAGKRVELVSCNDPYTKLRSGDKGTYQFCIEQSDGKRQHAIHWDNGSKLMLLEGIDSFKFIEE